MEPMELSVYKFKLFQRLSASSPGILGERVCVVMFIFSKHNGVKNARSWCLLRLKALKSGSKWFSNSTYIKIAWGALKKIPILMSYPTPIK